MSHDHTEPQLTELEADRWWKTTQAPLLTGVPEDAQASMRARNEALAAVARYRGEIPPRPAPVVCPCCRQAIDGWNWDDEDGEWWWDLQWWKDPAGGLGPESFVCSKECSDARMRRRGAGGVFRDELC